MGVISYTPSVAVFARGLTHLTLIYIPACITFYLSLIMLTFSLVQQTSNTPGVGQNVDVKFPVGVWGLPGGGALD